MESRKLAKDVSEAGSFVKRTDKCDSERGMQQAMCLLAALRTAYIIEKRRCADDRLFCLWFISLPWLLHGERWRREDKLEDRHYVAEAEKTDEEYDGRSREISSIIRLRGPIIGERDG
jgi:hypothetical protein